MTAIIATIVDAFKENPWILPAVFFGGGRFVLFADDAIFRRARKSTLMADQRLQHRLAVGDGQADAQRHQCRQEQEGAIPASGKQFLLRYQIKAGDGKGGGQK